MQNELLRVFMSLEKNYETIIIEENGITQVFTCILRAAFAKNYEFNCICNSLTDQKDAYFLMASLRGICEDLIAIKYLKDKIHIDRDELLSLMVQKGTLEGIVIQREFFRENKPEQIIVDVTEAETEIEAISEKIKNIFIKNGLKGDKDFPTISHMATDSKLIKLYNYLYYATSKLVHFEPGLLLRLGWAENMISRKFRFSTKNFNKYYYDFCSYYSAFLFIQFYKVFKRDLQLETLFKKDIKLLQTILNDTVRMPEIITFEELNIKPPSDIIRLLTKSAQRLSE